MMIKISTLKTILKQMNLKKSCWEEVPVNSFICKVQSDLQVNHFAVICRNINALIKQVSDKRGS